MFQFILVDIVMLSLGGILYLVVRALPRIEEGEPDPDAHSFIDRIIHSHIPHKIDVAVAAYSGKLFRKLKVVLMKLDNYLTNRLKIINIDSGGTGGITGKPKIDLSEITKKETAVDEEEPRE